jgi:hypothetical protein
MSPAAMRTVTGEVTNGLQQLREEKRRLETMLVTIASDPGRRARLHQVAESTRGRLESMTAHERRSVCELLDVRVTVRGWDDCPRCEGRRHGQRQGQHLPGVPCRWVGARARDRRYVDRRPLDGDGHTARSPYRPSGVRRGGVDTAQPDLEAPCPEEQLLTNSRAHVSVQPQLRRRGDYHNEPRRPPLETALAAEVAVVELAGRFFAELGVAAEDNRAALRRPSGCWARWDLTYWHRS